MGLDSESQSEPGFFFFQLQQLNVTFASEVYPGSFRKMALLSHMIRHYNWYRLWDSLIVNLWRSESRVLPHDLQTVIYLNTESLPVSTE